MQGKIGLPQGKAHTNSLGEVVLPLAAVAVVSMIKKVIEATSSTTGEKQIEIISSVTDIKENKELVEKAKVDGEVELTPPTVITTTEGKMVMGTHGGVLIRAVSNRKRDR